MNNMKRMRGRNHRSPGGGGNGGGAVVRHQSGNIPMNRNHVFDSSGPDLRIRGTAQQLSEKYLQLGRDATSVGDRVMAESYFQYAEHYFRIMGAMQAAQQQTQPYNQGQANAQNGGQASQPNSHAPTSHQGQQGYPQIQDRGQAGPAQTPIQARPYQQDYDRRPSQAETDPNKPAPIQILPQPAIAGLGEQPEPAVLAPPTPLADAVPSPPPAPRARRAHRVGSTPPAIPAQPAQSTPDA